MNPFTGVSVSVMVSDVPLALAADVANMNDPPPWPRFADVTELKFESPT